MARFTSAVAAFVIASAVPVALILRSWASVSREVYPASAAARFSDTFRSGVPTLGLFLAGLATNLVIYDLSQSHLAQAAVGLLIAAYFILIPSYVVFAFLTWRRYELARSGGRPASPIA